LVGPEGVVKLGADTGFVLVTTPAVVIPSSIALFASDVAPPIFGIYPVVMPDAVTLPTVVLQLKECVLVL
jgi:hypothetical protein